MSVSGLEVSVTINPELSLIQNVHIQYLVEVKNDKLDVVPFDWTKVNRQIYVSSFVHD